MLRRLFYLATALLVPAIAGAEEIRFDEYPPANNLFPSPSEEYASMGVHFIATDDGSVWGGMSGGNPGGWGLEGTNGPAFAGFNGKSYGLGVVFDAPVREVSVDVARSLSSRVGDRFILRGWRDGAMIEEVDVVLGNINVWSTVALTQEVDEISWVGVGTPTKAHPYGVDNLRWTSAPQELAVAIDVRPASAENRVNPFGQGVVQVALLGSDDFDVTAVDVTTLGFGPLGAPAVHSAVEDSNEDGRPDLVTHHRIPETGIALGDAEACLVGATLDGMQLRGCDAVSTVPNGGANEASHAQSGRGPKPKP